MSCNLCKRQKSAKLSAEVGGLARKKKSNCKNECTNQNENFKKKKYRKRFGGNDKTIARDEEAFITDVAQIKQGKR